jgi:hypothetical protein
VLTQQDPCYPGRASNGIVQPRLDERLLHVRLAGAVRCPGVGAVSDQIERAHRLPFGNVDTAVMHDPDVPAMPKLVYAYLCTYCARAREAFPSKARIARELGLDVRTIDRAIKVLESLGLLQVVKRRSEQGDWSSNLYVIHDFGERAPGTGTNGGTGTDVGTPPGRDGGTPPAEMSPEEDQGSPPVEQDQEEISLDLGLELPPTSKTDAPPSKVEGPGYHFDPRVTGQDITAEFELFWEAYPRKVSKDGARRKHEQLVRRGVDPRVILAGAKRYAQQREGQDKAFTKHPTTWLNNGCWADEDEAAPARANGHRPYKDADQRWGEEYDPGLTGGGDGGWRR